MPAVKSTANWANSGRDAGEAYACSAWADPRTRFRPGGDTTVGVLLGEPARESFSGRAAGGCTGPEAVEAEGNRHPRCRGRRPCSFAMRMGHGHETKGGLERGQGRPTGSAGPCGPHPGAARAPGAGCLQLRLGLAPGWREGLQDDRRPPLAPVPAESRAVSPRSAPRLPGARRDRPVPGRPGGGPVG